MKKIFTLLIVAALFVACGDESSSSAPASDPSEESSSSVEMTKESSSSVATKNSSSSVDGDKNSSSSAKKEESSSSAVKASSSSTTPKSSSSEEVKQSSSSVVASSSSVTSSETVKSNSSEYVPYNHRKALYSDSVLTGAYKQFTDTRNGRTYYYLTINGVDKNNKPASVTVMAENLNIGEMVDGEEDLKNDSKIERYCYDNDTTNCDKYGGLYQWAEMMNLPSECNTKSCADLIKSNHQGICPKGWRLLTEDDFYIILHADGNRHGAEDVRATSFGGYNYSGYSLLGAGYNWNHEFKRLGESSYWFYPEEEAEDSEMGALAGYQTKSLTSNGSQYTYKTNGFSVRCVKVE